METIKNPAVRLGSFDFFLPLYRRWHGWDVETRSISLKENTRRSGKQKWVEQGILEVITIPNRRHLVREDTLSELLK